MKLMRVMRMHSLGPRPLMPPMLPPPPPFMRRPMPMPMHMRMRMHFPPRLMMKLMMRRGGPRGRFGPFGHFGPPMLPPLLRHPPRGPFALHHGPKFMHPMHPMHPLHLRIMLLKRPMLLRKLQNGQMRRFAAAQDYADEAEYDDYADYAENFAGYDAEYYGDDEGYDESYDDAEMNAVSNAAYFAGDDYYIDDYDDEFADYDYDEEDAYELEDDENGDYFFEEDEQDIASQIPFAAKVSQLQELEMEHLYDDDDADEDEAVQDHWIDEEDGASWMVSREAVSEYDGEWEDDDEWDSVSPSIVTFSGHSLRRKCLHMWGQRLCLCQFLNWMDSKKYKCLPTGYNYADDSGVSTLPSPVGAYHSYGSPGITHHVLLHHDPQTVNYETIHAAPHKDTKLVHEVKYKVSSKVKHSNAMEDEYADDYYNDYADEGYGYEDDSMDAGYDDSDYSNAAYLEEDAYEDYAEDVYDEDYGYDEDSDYGEYEDYEYAEAESADAYDDDEWYGGEYYDDEEEAAYDAAYAEDSEYGEYEDSEYYDDNAEDAAYFQGADFYDDDDAEYDMSDYYDDEGASEEAEAEFYYEEEADDDEESRFMEYFEEDTVSEQNAEMEPEIFWTMNVFAILSGVVLCFCMVCYAVRRSRNRKRYSFSKLDGGATEESASECPGMDDEKHKLHDAEEDAHERGHGHALEQHTESEQDSDEYEEGSDQEQVPSMKHHEFHSDE